MTRACLLKEGAAALEKAGVGDALYDASLLLSRVTGRDALMLRLDREEAATEEENAFRLLIGRRAEREPLQYILGEAYFMGLSFEVTPDVLIPRFDTESMCENALERLPWGAEVLDLCTGSGAIAVSLKKERPDLKVSASDISFAALEVAKRNAERNDVFVEFFTGDLFAPFPSRRFDAVLSNPPYIPARELPFLQEEVRQEPALALDGGADGLELYRRIVSEAPEHLSGNGLLFLETGDGEADAVSGLMAEDFREIRRHKDLSGGVRSVSGVLRSERRKG